MQQLIYFPFVKDYLDDFKKSKSLLIRLIVSPNFWSIYIVYFNIIFYIVILITTHYYFSFIKTHNYIFGFISLPFAILLMLFLYDYKCYYSSSVKVVASIKNIEKRSEYNSDEYYHKLYITYELNGQVFENNINYKENWYNESTNNLEIYVNKKHPDMVSFTKIRPFHINLLIIFLLYFMIIGVLNLKN